MKMHLVVVVFLLFTTPLAAQPDYSKLPTLPVWYELNDTGYGQAMTYLPDFDTARKGFNALAHYVSENTSPTWYNRFQGDTENMFEWGKRVFISHRGDFDGDGKVDFYDEGRGMIYRGIENGRPPMLPAIAQYNVVHPISQHSIIADFNKDGKDDAIIRASNTPQTGSVIGSVLLGNADLTKMQVIPLPHTSKFDSIECIIDAFAKGDGTGRIVTWKWDKDRNNSWFTLWKLQIDTAAATVSYQYLDQLQVTPDNGDWISEGYVTFHLFQKIQHTIVVGGDILSLDGDTFQLLHQTVVTSVTYKTETSITHVNMPGWHRYGYKNNELQYVCYGGDPRRDTLPIAIFPFEIKTAGAPLRVSNVVGIGDINGDSLGDIAVAYGRWKFIIYLGTTSPVGVETTKPNDKNMLSLTITNPVKKNEMINLALRTLGEARLELYALGGGKIAELWRGTTDSTARMLELTLPPLAAGLYNLRLTDGRSTLDKALLITE